MGIFDIGSRHNLQFCDESVAATIIYNNGTIAVAGFERGMELGYSSEEEHCCNHFAITKEEITAFITDFGNTGTYNGFIVIDTANGNLVEPREWLRRNNALFIPGKRYVFAEEWGDCVGEAFTVYSHNGTAIVKIYDGEGCVYEAFKKYGYSAEDICSVFPQFKDEFPMEREEYFYMCVRECDDVYVDLQGETIDDKIYSLI